MLGTLGCITAYDRFLNQEMIGFDEDEKKGIKGCS